MNKKTLKINLLKNPKSNRILNKFVHIINLMVNKQINIELIKSKYGYILLNIEEKL